MKRSMRIGTKITVISCLVAVIAAIMLAVVTTVVFMSFVGTLQEEETNTGVNGSLLKSGAISKKWAT